MHTNRKSSRIMWVICLGLAVASLYWLRPAYIPAAVTAPDQTNRERTVVKLKPIAEMVPPPTEPIAVPPLLPNTEKLSAKPKATDEATDKGRMIPIVADYRRHLGFPVYVREMTRIGAMFLLFDPIREKLIAEVDIPNKIFKPINTSRLQAMSPNMREISNEIAVEELQQEARAAYDLPICSIIMLLPAVIDQQLTDQIETRLKSDGIDPARVTRVSGVYVLRTGGLALHVDRVDTLAGDKPAAFEVRL